MSILFRVLRYSSEIMYYLLHCIIVSSVILNGNFFFALEAVVVLKFVSPLCDAFFTICIFLTIRMSISSLYWSLKAYQASFISFDLAWQIKLHFIEIYCVSNHLSERFFVINWSSKGMVWAGAFDIDLSCFSCHKTSQGSPTKRCSSWQILMHQKTRRKPRH